MMYKCLDCGYLFEDGEQYTWTENQGSCHGVTATERFSGCPLCKGDYLEVRQCRECWRWHFEDELYYGWCEKCLRETINYDTFFEYCEANKDEQYLDIFVMSELLGGMDCPKHSSYEFHQLMIDVYKKEVDAIKFYEKQFGHKPSGDFLDACIRFIMEDDGECGRENYADWLNKRDVK